MCVRVCEQLLKVSTRESVCVMLTYIFSQYGEAFQHGVGESNICQINSGLLKKEMH